MIAFKDYPDWMQDKLARLLGIAPGKRSLAAPSTVARAAARHTWEKLSMRERMGYITAVQETLIAEAKAVNAIAMDLLQGPT